MKFYVAGKTNNIERVQRIQDGLRSAGHDITYDWTINVEEVGGAADEQHVPETQQAFFADKDREGVLIADAVIAIMGPDMSGTLIEIGMALAHNILVFVIGEPERRSVFFALPEVQPLTEDELDDVIAKVQAGRTPEVEVGDV